MANKNLFPSQGNAAAVPAVNTVNNAGGVAYSLPNRAALAQLAVTGCLNSTFYVSAETQLQDVLKLAQTVDSEFLGKLAVYSRTRGFMKDMPALLLAVIAARKDEESRRVLRLAFPAVIDNVKMLRNFAQIVRSGVTGRKNFGSLPRKLMQGFFQERSADRLFGDSIGDKPSLGNVIDMVHPRAHTAEHDGLYTYLIGKPTASKTLPGLVREYEAFKEKLASGVEATPPKVPFQMLASLPNIPESAWRSIAENAGWQMTRMNLNTFARHGVFSSKDMVSRVATRLRDPQEVAKSRVMPYQLLTAFQNVGDDMPMEIKLALQDAMEHATKNVRPFSGVVVVAVDVSGSMSSSPVTGHRKGSTTKMMAIDVAALVGSTILRTTPNALVLPFDTQVHTPSLNPRDSVMTNAQKLRRYGGGGTNCGLVLEKLNGSAAMVDLVIYVSDNESWLNSNRSHYFNLGTSMATEWAKLKKRCPKAKLVCIDLTPNTTTQVSSDTSVLNVGGFSDSVFDVIHGFVSGDANSWTQVIEATPWSRTAQTNSVDTEVEAE